LAWQIVNNNKQQRKETAMSNTHEVVLKVTITSEDMDGTTEETALMFDEMLTRLLTEAEGAWEAQTEVVEHYEKGNK